MDMLVESNESTATVNVERKKVFEQVQSNDCTNELT
jgi:hypothetical protein